MTDQALTDHKRSVKSGEFGKSAANKFTFWLPRYTPNTQSVLPPELPDPPVMPYYGLQSNARDQVLMSTPKFESMWGSVVGIETSKMAAAGWLFKSEKPRVQDRLQNVFLNSTAGVLTGWVPFSSAGFAGFINTGKRFVEVERYTSRSGSRIKAFHHLDPGRCYLTTDPEIPVLYVDSNGQEHEMRRHQVMMFFDMPDPEEKFINAPMSAAVRAYKFITQLSALNWYIYEKLTGRTPLAFHFVQGVSEQTLDDVIESSKEDANAQGVRAYMGAVMAAIMGDSPMNLVTVPLAEIPDGVDVERIREDAHLTYANAVGEDPTRIDPRLIGNRQLGAGTQAVVLDQKARQGGSLVSHKQDWTHQVNLLLRSEKIQFMFTETDMVDQKGMAEVSKTRAEERKIRIESGELSVTEARNLAVDHGDLPDEMLAVDETGVDVIRDDEQPTEKREDEAPPEEPQQPEELEVTEKQIDPTNDEELAALIAELLPASQELYRSQQ